MLWARSYKNLKATLSTIMMEVENGYIWKVISIGDTPIFIHFPLPWLWETCILLNFLDTVWIFQDLPTSDFFLENLDIWKAGLPISFRWLLLRSWVPPLMEMLYMEVGQAWGWRCIFNSHQLIGLLLCVRATIHYYFLYSYWFVVVSPYLYDLLCYLYPLCFHPYWLILLAFVQSKGGSWLQQTFHLSVLPNAQPSVGQFMFCKCFLICVPKTAMEKYWIRIRHDKNGTFCQLFL